MFVLLYSTVFADGWKNNNLIWKKVKTHEKDHNSGIKWEKYNDQNDFLFTEKGCLLYTSPSPRDFG